MYNYALFNILLAFATAIISLISAAKRKDKDLQPFEIRKVYIAKTVALSIGALACLVCLFSEQSDPTVVWADKWSIVLVILLIGELVADYFVNKKTHPKD